MNQNFEKVRVLPKATKPRKKKIIKNRLARILVNTIVSLISVFLFMMVIPGTMIVLRGIFYDKSFNILDLQYAPVYLIYWSVFGGFWFILLILFPSSLIFYYVYNFVKKLGEDTPQESMQEIPKQKQTKPGYFARIFVILLMIATVYQFIAYPLNNYIYCSKTIQTKEYTLKSNPNFKFEVKDPEKIKQYANYSKYNTESLFGSIETVVRYPWESISCKTISNITLKLKNTDISFVYKVNEPIDVSTFNKEVDNAININRIFSFALPDNKLVLKENYQSSFARASNGEPLFSINNNIPVIADKYYVFSDNQLGLGKLDFELKENQRKVADVISSNPELSAQYNQVVLYFSSVVGDKRVAFRFGYTLFTFYLEKSGDNFIIQKILKTELMAIN